MAIKLKIKKAEGEYDQGLSKMLGNPVLPEGLVDTLPSSVMFLMQIRLEDIKDLDEDNVDCNNKNCSHLNIMRNMPRWG